MENHIDDVEFELPLEIIQHIQSMIQHSSTKFMGEKEAARTTLVSKSWYRAWSTRPDLVFCRFNFPSSGGDLFWEVAKTTLKRYEDLNLNIRSLRLVLIDGGGSLAKELIVKAIKLGVVDLTIQIVAVRDRVNCFVKPDDDIESAIARLNLRGSASITINLSLDRTREKGKVITCYNLKSLKLKNLVFNYDLFRDLMLRCPFIEEFLGPLYHTELRYDEFLDKLLHQFPKLESLSLGVRRPTKHDLLAKFACLKELKIHYCGYDGDLRMCIPSLERISISGLDKKMNVEFDFPNIRKFKLEGNLPRRFELKTSSTRRDEWESKIYIIYRIKFEREWFSRLRQFVRMLSLSRSRVSLDIFTVVRNWDEFAYDPRYFGEPIPAVKKLTLRGNKAVTRAFLDALFWSCRPKFVIIKNEGFHGLEEVNVEVFKQMLLLPWKMFYRVSTHEYGYGYDVRFQLNWG